MKSILKLSVHRDDNDKSCEIVHVFSRSIKSSTSDPQELKSVLNNSSSDQNQSSKTTNGMDSLTSDSSDCQVSGCEDSSDGSRTSESRKMSTSPENDSKPNHLPVSPSPDQPTFFSTMPHRFVDTFFSVKLFANIFNVQFF